MLDVTSHPKKFSRMSTHDRLKHLGASLIATKDVKTVVEIGETLWEEAGCMPEGGGAFIIGETRVGKSTAVAEFADQLFDSLRAERPDAMWERPVTTGTPIRGIAEVRPQSGYQRPLVVVFVDPLPTFKSLMKNTAQAMGITLKSGFTFGDVMVLVKRHVDKQGIKMIIFDEVQHIASRAMAYEAADVLKVMCKVGLQVVGVGLPKALDLGTINEQLGELTAHNYTLTPLACSLADFPELDGDGNPLRRMGRPTTAYGKLLAALDNTDNPVLPFDVSSNLSHPQMALRLHRATGGYVGRIMRLLMSATHLAVRRNLSKLGPKVLADAYRAKAKCNDDANLFLMDWPDFLQKREASQLPDSENEDEKDETKPSKPAKPKPRPRRFLRSKR